MNEVRDTIDGEVAADPVVAASSRLVVSGDRPLDLRDEEKKRRIDQLFETAVILARNQLVLLEAVVESAGRRRLKSNAGIGKLSFLRTR